MSRIGFCYRKQVPGPRVGALCATVAIVENQVVFSKIQLIYTIGGGPETMPEMCAYTVALR